MIEDDYDLDDELPPSKTSIKKAMLDITALGEELVNLPIKKLAQIPLTENLAQAIEQARGMKANSAKKRQIQFIGKLMRKQDLTPITDALEAMKQKDLHHTHLHHQAENWRDKLIQDPSCGSEFIDSHPNCDRQAFNQLLRAAAREQQRIEEAKQQSKKAIAPKETRKLFALIRDTINANP